MLTPVLWVINLGGIKLDLMKLKKPIRVLPNGETRHCQGCLWDWKGVCLHPKAKKEKPSPGCVDYQKKE
jgi:hypothetical protein